MVKRMAVALVLLMVSGCAAKIDYKMLEAHMGTGNCKGASAYMQGQKDKYGDNQKLIYLMDTGMVDLYCGNYGQSAKALERADVLVRDLWTRSISKEGVSFLTNDYTIPYAGEDFEKVMVNLFHSMDFALMDDYESALVEVRQMNQQLVEINEKYEKKSVYREDAFARYMSAILYESENSRDLQNLDSAAIDYERGLAVYESYLAEYGIPIPEAFKEDYYRVAEATGRLKDARAMRKKMDWPRHNEVRDMGRIVMIHLSGKAPVKQEESVVAYGPHGPIKVAFPKFVSMPPGCSESSLVAHGSQGESFRAATELVEDLSAIAIKNLEDRKGRVVAKTIARAIAKQVTVNAAAKQSDDSGTRLAIMVIGRVAAAASEVADTRSWRTLPGRIYMARSYVPADTYTVEAEYCGRKKVLANAVEIKPGQTKFVLLENVY